MNKKLFLLLVIVASLLISQELYAQKIMFSRGGEKLLPTTVQNEYDVKWIFLNLTVDNQSTYLSGYVTTKAEVVAPVMDTFSFHLSSYYTIDSIKVNNIKTTFIDNNDEHLITNLGLPKGSVIDVQVFYHGSVPGSGMFFSGISNDTHWAYNTFRTTWTLSEPNAAYQWFPVKQVLTDKVDSVRFYATTQLGNRVGCNGILEGIDTLSAENKVRFRWNAAHYNMAYYLICFSCANYQDYSYKIKLPGYSDSLLIQNYIYNSPQCFNDSKTVIDMTGEMITFFSDVYGLYPFIKEKYGHCIAPMGGAMEHQTMTTTGLFWESVIAHELAHQWFGDKVTCGSWQDIFVNESFAAYSEFLWEEYKHGWNSAINTFQSVRQNVFNNGRSGSIYVPASQIDNENRIFSGVLSYDKGATVLHHLRFILGDEVFFNVYKTYLENNAYSSGSVEKVKEATMQVTGEDFGFFFDQWVYGEGYPIFNIVWEQTGDSLEFLSTQTTTASITPFFYAPFQLKILYSDGSSEIITLTQTKPVTYFYTDLANGKTISSITFDPDRWILAQGYLTKGIVVGIDNHERESIVSIYPNPATTQVTVSSESLINKIEVSSTNGAILLSAICESNSITCNLHNFSKGIYIMKVFTNNGCTIKKLVVQ